MSGCVFFFRELNKSLLDIFKAQKLEMLCFMRVKPSQRPRTSSGSPLYVKSLTLPVAGEWGSLHVVLMSPPLEEPRFVRVTSMSPSLMGGGGRSYSS